MPRVLGSILRVVVGASVVVILIAILFTGDYSHAPRYRQEIAAIRALRAIHTAQVQYYSQYSEYAASLKELGELASGTINGYRFVMTGNASGYVIHADPESFGKTGSRTFYSDQTMTIRQNYGQEPATITSPELK